MNNYSLLVAQKKRIERLYSCFTVEITGFTSYELICKGELQPIESVNKYKIEIKMRPNRKPVVRIISPTITPNPKIHTYSDGSLCLYYPVDMPWKANTYVADYTIPWIVEWILYYEIFQITKKWEGKEAPHSPLKNDL